MSIVLQSILALFTIASSQSQSPPECPYLPAFEALLKRLPDMKVDEAIVALARYRAEHDNPAACEALELDRLMSEREASRIHLVARKTRLQAQAVYHCATYDLKTTRCDGDVADGTAHPFISGIRPLPIPDVTRLTILSRLSDAKLTAIYTSTFPDLLDGIPATRLSGQMGMIQIGRKTRPFVLIAIFKGTHLRAYLKAAWYFQ